VWKRLCLWRIKINNSWFKFFIIGTELAGTILAGLFIGDLIDKKLDTNQTFTIVGIVLGTLTGFVIMIKILKMLGR
tara:strand:+ start:1095 stop:1322 length:228 start_codon:yes stop_codon:yes gene_type:complete